jgi:hypothetical protein
VSPAKFNYLDSSFLIESGPNQGNPHTTPFTKTTQSWENNIPNVLGLTTITENSQKEFYDGEYSGSNLIAFEPPLFNNPFLKPSTIEPFYSASVVNVGLRDYYSIPEDTVFEFIEGDPSITEVTAWVNTSMSMATSSVVWVTGSVNPVMITIGI